MKTLRSVGQLVLVCGLALPGQAQWFQGLRPGLQKSILWSADHEEGNLDDWEMGGGPNAGGGIFNTGGSEVWAVASASFAHSGLFSAEATITGAIKAQNGNRAVRLMRWTEKPWQLGGSFFPDRAYYSTWMFIPEACNPNKYAPWDPGDGGWWNVFQFKSDDASGVSQPMCALNIYHDDATGQLEFYLYSKYNPPFSFGQASPVPVPIGQWFHLEALYEVSSSGQGKIKFWQDGVKILDLKNVLTVLPGGDEAPVWGLGNYTDHVDCPSQLEGTATLYFDDCAVSKRPLHRGL